MMSQSQTVASGDTGFHPHRMIERGEWRNALVSLLERRDDELDVEERVLRCFLLWFFEPEKRYNIAHEADKLLVNLEGRLDTRQVREHRALCLVLAALAAGTNIGERWNQVNRAYGMIRHKHRRSDEERITQFDYLAGWFVCLNALQTYMAIDRPRAKTMRSLYDDLQRFSRLAKGSIEEESILRQLAKGERELKGSLKDFNVITG